MKSGNSEVNRNNDNQTYGFSARCLKDAPKTLTYVASVGGYINATGTGTTTQEVAYGGDGEEVIAIPADGYEFLQWSDGSTSTTRIDLNITDTMTVTAEFFKSFVSCGDPMLDTRDYNIYNTVQIGTQCWFQKNLAYLPAVHRNSEFATQGSSQLPGYGVYGYDGSNVVTAKSQPNYSDYGVLYNWYAVNQSGDSAICPTGWHVPTDTEWTTLTTYLGTNAGSKLAGSYNLWNDGALRQSANFGNSGFNALPAGYREGDGVFRLLGGYTLFWSSSESGPGISWNRNLYSGSSGVGRVNGYRTDGYSVRCLRTE